MKPRLHKSFSFSFSLRKSLKMVNMQSKCVLTHQIWTSLPLCAHVRFLQDSTPLSTCVRTLWMAPLQQNNLIFSVITIHLGYDQKLSWKYCNYYHLPYIKISIFYQKYGHLAQNFCSLSSQSPNFMTLSSIYFCTISIFLRGMGVSNSYTVHFILSLNKIDCQIYQKEN